MGTIKCIECLIKVKSYNGRYDEGQVIGCCSVCFKHMLNRLKIESNDQRALKIARLYEPDQSQWGELYNE